MVDYRHEPAFFGQIFLPLPMPASNRPYGDTRHAHTELIEARKLTGHSYPLLFQLDLCT